MRRRPIQRPIANPVDALARHPAIAYRGPSSGPNAIPVAAINRMTGTMANPSTTKANMTAGSAYHSRRYAESQAASSSMSTLISDDHCHAATISAQTTRTTPGRTQTLIRGELIRITPVARNCNACADGSFSHVSARKLVCTQPSIRARHRSQSATLVRFDVTHSYQAAERQCAGQWPRVIAVG